VRVIRGEVKNKEECGTLAEEEGIRITSPPFCVSLPDCPRYACWESFAFPCLSIQDMYAVEKKVCWLP
jgi:hypothetical protein